MPPLYSSRDEPEVMMEINTTPLIDVMLVLLVMLIITIPIQLHAVNLDMPVGNPPNAAPSPELQIDIDAKSVVYWQGTPIAAEELEAKLTTLAQQPVQPVLKIRPNKDSQYAVFANVLSSTRRKGLNKVAVIGSEQFVR